MLKVKTRNTVYTFDLFNKTVQGHPWLCPQPIRYTNVRIMDGRLVITTEDPCISPITTTPIQDIPTLTAC